MLWVKWAADGGLFSENSVRGDGCSSLVQTPDRAETKGEDQSLRSKGRFTDRRVLGTRAVLQNGKRMLTIKKNTVTTLEMEQGKVHY